MKSSSEGGWLVKCDGCGHSKQSIPDIKLGDFMSALRGIGWTFRDHDYCSPCSKSHKPRRL